MSSIWVPSFVLPLQVQQALSSAQARIAELEQELEAAVSARDEFVYHLSPHKQRRPLPPGSPAPRADKDQLRAALKVRLVWSILLAICWH